jgi:glycosyltransferase involved in cell wall biosynthesis
MLPRDSDPAISVIMPVRNGLPYVGTAIASVLDQSFRDFELLAIDDGSDDDTVSVLEAAAAQDNRIRVIQLPKSGMRTAVNHGLELARAALVARMDADDVCLPDRFRLQKDFLDKHPEVVAVGGWAWAIDEQGERMFSIKCQRKQARWSIVSCKAQTASFTPR